MGLRRASRQTPLLVGSLWLAGLVASARAQQAEPSEAPRAVVLDGTGCPQLTQSTLHELVALELAPRPVLSPAQLPAPARPLWARLACRGTQAELQVQDELRGSRQELTLDLTETVASGQTRLVALAISELVVTLELEAQSPQREPATSPAPVAPHTARSEGAQRAAHARGDVWLSAGLVRAGRPALLGWALDVGARGHLGQLPLALRGMVGVAHAAGPVEDGRVRNWMLMGSLALVPTLRRAWIEAGVGAGLRVGHAWLHGTPADAALDGGEVQAFWWGPELTGDVLVPVYGRWGVRAAIDLTYVLKPVRGLSASGDVAYAVERFVLMAALGIALGF